MASGRWRFVTLLSVVLVCAAIITLTMRLRSSENTVEAQQQALAAQAAALGAQEVAIRANRDAVRELCRTNGILSGLVSEYVSQQKDAIRRHDLSKQAELRTETTVSIFEGYLDQLGQQTACREVVRP